MTTRAFAKGLRDGLPFLLVVLPFALLFGVVAHEAGLDLAQIMGFSVLVLAGASQFTAVQLLADNAPALIVIVSALAVNLRMAMYSASLVPHLGAAPLRMRALIAYLLIDQTYALSDAEFTARPARPLAEKIAYFMGTSVTLCLPWMAMTAIGATMGRAIPPAFALDFAVPITFLAMIAPALRSLPHVVAAAVSVIGALVFSVLPHGLGLLVAAPLAMVAGARTELFLARRAARRGALG
ncbi:AzlC family ABC transporter permease [Paracoccus sp. p3-h83]|uniref:AzlC family ABC transporter permease n=1 Tax=Paracoccus sp. p3-h83 TaxID=3342805 RepID=UPI0035BB83C3